MSTWRLRERLSCALWAGNYGREPTTPCLNGICILMGQDRNKMYKQHALCPVLLSSMEKNESENGGQGMRG